MDPDLVVQAQGGDHAAFERLALDVSDRVHGVAFNILRDADQAEDATQQTLLAVWRDLPQLRDPARFEASSVGDRRLPAAGSALGLRVGSLE